MIGRGYQMDGPRAGGPALLARQIGVHRSTISRILNGSIPKPPVLEAIARELGIPKTEALIAAGIVQRDDLPAADQTREAEPNPDPEQVLTGGLRDQHEQAIWDMTAVPWQARVAAITAMREEARRLATKGATGVQSTRRPA
jgi:transcriptional regulator with XRE-family HTH domain